ncbi:MAG: hypothetical protein EA342_16715 [Leptolyngbya sp. LCM1.Bin17]|nr:MAG: hypothetical protein EA342_16715 [Leptolyngbya sp. LCM1.Bin17]
MGRWGGGEMGRWRRGRPGVCPGGELWDGGWALGRNGVRLFRRWVGAAELAGWLPSGIYNHLMV